jgi:cytochrome c peroxidase
MSYVFAGTLLLSKSFNRLSIFLTSSNPIYPNFVNQMKFLFSIAVLFLFISVLLSCQQDPDFPLPTGDGHIHYDLNVPAGLPSMTIPADNPMTVEGIALGRKLFFEKLLSATNTMSCATCHRLKSYTVDSNLRYSTGVDNIQGTRNSMPLFNVGYSPKLMWDGSASSLETQARLPIINPIEMHETMDNVVSKLQAHPEYPNLFLAAFGSSSINGTNISRALAQFQRTLISGNSKFDRWRRGEVSFTDQETRGMNVYIAEEKGDCTHCHSYGSTFTDFGFRNTGLDSIPVDKGLALVTKLSSDEGKFKTPTLRNIAKTAPYMHDGRFQTLRECIQHYNKNFHYTANLAFELKTVTKNRMNDADIDDLIAFLNTLTDEEFINNPAFTEP